VKWLFLIACLVPSLVEAWLDRKGETTLGKYKDTIWLVVASLGLAGVAWWLGQRPLPVIGLVLGWRILVFDYLVTWLLIRNDVINPNAKWWDYTGKTSKIDQWVSKIDWKVRLLIRGLIFISCLLYFHGS
jgi:hypothetical protein